MQDAQYRVWSHPRDYTVKDERDLSRGLRLITRKALDPDLRHSHLQQPHLQPHIQSRIQLLRVLTASASMSNNSTVVSQPMQASVML